MTSAHNGQSEGFIDGSTGIGVPERDRDALVEALLRFLTDDDFAESARRNGRLFAEDQLDIALHTRQLEQFYYEIAAAALPLGRLVQSRRALMGFL